MHCKKTFHDVVRYEKMKELSYLNPPRPDPGRREKINLNFYFHTSLWCLKRFYEGLSIFPYSYGEIEVHALISNTFISNVRLKLAKHQVNSRQQPEAELLLFENYSHSSSTLSSKNNRSYSKK